MAQILSQSVFHRVKTHAGTGRFFGGVDSGPPWPSLVWFLGKVSRPHLGLVGGSGLMKWLVLPSQ